MKEDTVTLPIIELGRAVATITIKGDELEGFAKEAVQREIDKLNEVLSYITDVRVVEEIKSIVGPKIDVLQRFRAVGYYGVIASEGYNTLSKHFACTRKHTPEQFDWNFVKAIAKSWFRYKKYSFSKWERN